MNDKNNSLSYSNNVGVVEVTPSQPKELPELTDDDFSIPFLHNRPKVVEPPPE